MAEPVPTGDIITEEAVEAVRSELGESDRFVLKHIAERIERDGRMAHEWILIMPALDRDYREYQTDAYYRIKAKGLVRRQGDWVDMTELGTAVHAADKAEGRPIEWPDLEKPATLPK